MEKSFPIPFSARSNIHTNVQVSFFFLLWTWYFCISQGVLFQENDHKDRLHSWLLLYFLSCCIFYYFWQQIKARRGVFSLASREYYTHLITSLNHLLQWFLSFSWLFFQTFLSFPKHYRVQLVLIVSHYLHRFSKGKCLIQFTVQETCQLIKPAGNVDIFFLALSVIILHPV